MTLRPLLASLCAAALALACIGCDDPVSPIEGEILAGISGDGDGNGFMAVDDGTEVTLEPGSQGGFHVWLNLSVHGLTGTMKVEREARRVVDDGLIYRGQRQKLEIPGDAMLDWWDNPRATPAFMCPSPLGIQVFDEDVQFEIRVLDDDDNVLAVDQIVLTPRCPTGDEEAFCRRICSG